ncbi:MAG: hypothetical protein AMJ78_06360 [Omnitrophica WOR_2 bacterium SM23_29]|nr:MAG: hypothetical protein AMJ78_06360 [Omnitrophica WOR_2 bacterium SM23_29]
MIPLSEPCIRGNEWKYIKQCLDTGWVSSAGSYVTRFEEVVKQYVGTRYAVAVVNGTSALHVSLLGCGVMPGDEVIVPAFTFVAPVNVVEYCGSEPVFIDCEDSSLCVDTDKLADFVKKKTKQKRDGFAYNKDSGRRIKAIIPVHMYGHPANIDAIKEICEPRNIDIIEDATESFGSEYKAKKTGSLGKIGCLSFNGNKIITTGGGGMVLTDDKSIAVKIKHLTIQAKKNTIEYDHDEVGYNYRLTNIQAAMGVAQMEKLEERVKIKRKNALFYRELISSIRDVKLFWEQPWARSNFWLYTIRIPKRHRNSLIKYLLSKNIQARPVWKPINTLPMYKHSQAYKVSKAKVVYETSINIPSSVTLTEEQIRKVCKTIGEFLKR